MAAPVTDLILGTITTLEGATRHYDVVKDDKASPRPFMKRALGWRRLAGDPQSAIKSLEACNTSAKLAKSLFEAVAQAPETSRFERYKAAVGQVAKGRTVEVLVTGMMSDVCALAENDAIKAAMENQAMELRDTISKLSEMEPSVPKKKSRDTYTNFGSGDMLNAPGGKVTKNTFDKPTFSGPVTF